MSTENQNNIPEEIDLGILLKKINGFFSNIAFSIFKGMLFVKKNIVILSALIISGVLVGYFLDYENTNYESNIIVSPNLGTTDYLYSKIDLLTSKLKEKDIVFFKSIGIQNPESLSSIDIEPIIDIYSFVNNNTAIASNAQNTQNFELMKLLAESGDINKVIKDKITSKNYPYHNIHIITTSKTNAKATIDPILKYLNTDEYFEKILNVSKENVEIKIKKDEEIISQTDSLINTLTSNLSKNQKNSNLVYNNENNQFNTLFELKNTLISEIANKKIERINLHSFIKEVSIVINIKSTKGTNGKMKLLTPILFLFLFISFCYIRAFYKKQASKLNR